MSDLPIEPRDGVGMRATIVRRSFVAMLVVGAACETPIPTAAPVANAPAVTGPVYSPPKFPPLDGPSRTFIFDHAPWPNVMSYTVGSQFVLYDTGGFVLQYPGLAYRGGYTEIAGGYSFDWEGW